MYSFIIVTFVNWLNQDPDLGPQRGGASYHIKAHRVTLLSVSIWIATETHHSSSIVCLIILLLYFIYIEIVWIIGNKV